ALPAQGRVDGVTSGSGLLVNHRSILSNHTVEDRGLPHVRPADEDRAHLIVEFRWSFDHGHEVDDAVEEIRRPSTMERRYRDRVPQAEGEEHGYPELGAVRVDLVRNDEHGDP